MSVSSTENNDSMSEKLAAIRTLPFHTSNMHAPQPIPIIPVVSHSILPRTHLPNTQFIRSPTLQHIQRFVPYRQALQLQLQQQIQLNQLQTQRQINSQQQRRLLQTHISTLQQQLYLQQQQVEWERYKQRGLQQLYRQEQKTHESTLYQKLIDLQVLEYKQLQQQLSYEQQLLKQQELLQEYLANQRSQYELIHDFEQRTLDLQRSIQESREILETREKQRLQLLEYQQELQQQIDVLQKKQANTTHLLFTPQKTGINTFFFIQKASICTTDKYTYSIYTLIYCLEIHLKEIFYHRENSINPFSPQFM